MWEVGGRLRKRRTYTHLRLTHADVRQRPAQYCKAIRQLKINFKKEDIQLVDKYIKSCSTSFFVKEMQNGNVIPFHYTRMAEMKKR